MTEQLRVERWINAPADAVFDAFTSRDGQVALYGTDEPGWVVDSAMDLRVGGLWRVCFGPSRDHLYEHRSVFEAIDRPRRILVTTTELHPDRPSFDFSIEFTFEERDGRTLMAMTQSGFPTRDLRDEHGLGAPRSLERLDRFVRSGG